MTVKLDGTNGLLQNYDYQTPSTGFSYTFTSFNVALFNPSGTLATGTITMPASPVDGMTVTFTSTQDITALTVNANTGQSIVGGGSISIPSNTSRTFIYRASNTTWYPQTIAAPVDVQTFNSTATWTKPTGGQTMARIQVWGGGGGGSRSASSNSAFGGGGGGYNEITVPLSYLASSLTVNVGAGGAGSTVSTAGIFGGTGGTSSVTLSTAWNGTTTVAAYGGSGPLGGGPLSAGDSTINFVAGNPAIITSGTDAAGMGYGGATGYGGIWHGAGGSYANTGANTSGAGSLFGGGGGVGAAGILGGKSVYGGAGGAGSSGASNAGVAPGGGGGASAAANTNGGAGAAGRVIITCW